MRDEPAAALFRLTTSGNCLFLFIIPPLHARATLALYHVSAVAACTLDDAVTMGPWGAWYSAADAMRCYRECRGLLNSIIRRRFVFFFVIFGGGRLGGCVCVVAGRGIAEVGLKCGGFVVDVYGEYWMVY